MAIDGLLIRRSERVVRERDSQLVPPEPQPLLQLMIRAILRTSWVSDAAAFARRQHGDDVLFDHSEQGVAKATAVD